MTLSDGVSPSPHLQRRIREVQVFLEENLDRDVDLRTIAREASLSPYYFTRQFTAYVGVPPYRYLIGLRIERAKDLLRESELTVTQICHRVGFNSLSHFTTTFRQHTGFSPSAYRRRKDWEQEAFRFGSITDTSDPPAEQADEPVGSRAPRTEGPEFRRERCGSWPAEPRAFRSSQLEPKFPPGGTDLMRRPRPPIPTLAAPPCLSAPCRELATSCETRRSGHRGRPAERGDPDAGGALRRPRPRCGRAPGSPANWSNA